MGGAGPKIAGIKVCYASDEEEARKLVHKLWPNMGLPGELAQILPTPAHFEQAAELVTEEMVADDIPTGDDPEDYVKSIKEYADAGYDEIYIHNIGPHHQEFFSSTRSARSSSDERFLCRERYLSSERQPASFCFITRSTASAAVNASARS